MLSATELNFSTRQRGDLPAWVANPIPRQSLRLWALADAKSVTLRLEISGFKPSAGTEFRGTRVGDLIVFKEEHIFGASP